MSKWFTHENVFMVISLSMAGVFGWGFFQEAGIPPTRVQDNWVPLIIFLIFLTLPFAKKLDFFQFFSFEAKVDEVKREVEETSTKVASVRDDVRHLITQQSVLNASVQSIAHQQVNIHQHYAPPTPEQAKEAVEAVADIKPVASPEPLEKKQDDLSERFVEDLFKNWQELGESDRKRSMLISSLDDYSSLRRLELGERAALLRMRVERELKRLVDEPGDGRRPVPYRSLLRSLAKTYPEIENQIKSFEVFYRISSAAVHAEDVPFEDLTTAIYLGERLLTLLLSLSYKDDDRKRS